MSWFLDSNIVIFCLRGKSPAAMRKIMSTPSSAIKVALQVKAELLLGAAKSAKPIEGRIAVLNFIQPFQVIAPDDEVLAEYVLLRLELERAGTTISEADLWIAATAMARGATLVTNNTKEFGRVPDLSLEDWSKPED
ncbi:MAG: type II toxin-antitoxin system VapC family toxin [Verrucomicrobia bacterium]|nr:type II toxin-antitoxin system VapC family toxin [Verrucomicrobiota bacterium]